MKNVKRKKKYYECAPYDSHYADWGAMLSVFQIPYAFTVAANLVVIIKEHVTFGLLKYRTVNNHL